ncbi:hypothetical protein ASG37_15895 [Sphingomonas sp. Leaf407]|uniref:hypothetical protein n=1 Tax=unclassified Sphingomonas TaxID=196159 RepID=UPI0006F1D3E6|nr:MULTISPECIES: hypothetical protein [unclassified Sphingomonas]KQN34797.1 hypothetical protein ASE97_15150 [Sphingomonas sp. Leaf42]KQT25350.1 hypothetical protein ASG37_15895 [Sphingomonas sp. Leaf407]
MNRKFRGLMLAGSALLLAGGLAACSNDTVDEAPIENSAFDEEAPPPVEANTDVSYEPVPDIVGNATAAAPVEDLPPPPPPVEPDQQVLDDASATGLTSRSTRGEPTPPADDAPVDDVMSNQSGE